MHTECVRESEHVSTYRVTIDGTAYHFDIAQLPSAIRMTHYFVMIHIRRTFLRRLLHLFRGVNRYDVIELHTVERGGLEDAIRFAERQIAKAHRQGLKSSTAQGYPGPERSRSTVGSDGPGL